VSSQTFRRDGACPASEFTGCWNKPGCVIIALPSKRGCSSVVEHLLAKEYRSIALTFAYALLSALL
jgi:hypothetical protein